MSLIEELGGYDNAEKFKNGECSDGFDVSQLRDELLNYRREHNIFEVGDKVVLKGCPLILSIRKFSGDSDDVYLLGWGWTTLKNVIHATDEEVKIGRRNEKI